MGKKNTDAKKKILMGKKKLEKKNAVDRLALRFQSQNPTRYSFCSPINKISSFSELKAYTVACALKYCCHFARKITGI